jgi:putative thioredoxin
MKNLPLQGAVDLAALAAAKSQSAQPKPASPFIVDVTDQTFEELLTQVSTRVPVILDLWATWCQPCKQLSPVLEKLAVEGNGAWVLAKIDVDANPGIAQAFKVQSIPSVYLVMAQKVQPLFQGVQPESALRQIIEQITILAKEQNLPGLGLPDQEAAEEEVEANDPAADLLMAGELDAAEKIYQERLMANPADADAKSSLALISLQRRVAGTDLTNLKVPTATDVSARLVFADSLILQGSHEQAYALLIESIKAVVGVERDEIKARLLELFEIADPADPVLLNARRALASALY